MADSEHSKKSGSSKMVGFAIVALAACIMLQQVLSFFLRNGLPRLQMCLVVFGGTIIGIMAACRVHVAIYTPPKVSPDRHKELMAIRHKKALEHTVCTMNWMNRFVMSIWPRIDRYIVAMMHDDVGPRIARAAPSLFSGSIHFTRVTLGDARPSFGPLRIRRRRDGNALLSIGLSWASDVDMVLKAGPMEIRISKLSLDAVFTVIFLTKPAYNKPPFFHGVQVFCSNQPSVALEFGGVAKVVGFPGIDHIIRSSIESAIGNMMVLPNCIGVVTGEEDDFQAADVNCANPVSVLRISLHSAANLIAADKATLVSKASSDPYVRMTVGVQSWTSSVLKKTLNPVWKDAVADFLVYDWDQVAKMEVYDEDKLSKDDLIGNTFIRILSLRSGDPMELPLAAWGSQNNAEGKKLTSLSMSRSMTQDLSRNLSTMSAAPPDEEDASGGHLKVSAQDLTFTDDKARMVEEGPSRVFITAKIVDVKEVDTKWKPPFTVRVSIHHHNDKPTAEAMTRQSTAATARTLPEETLRVCRELKKRAATPSTIAQIVGIKEKEVKELLLQDADPEQARKNAAAAQARRAATEPFFGQVLHLLCGNLEGEVNLEFCDSASKVVGAAKVPVQDILNAEQMCLMGPFGLSHSRLLGEKPSGTLMGSLSAKCIKVTNALEPVRKPAPEKHEQGHGLAARFQKWRHHKEEQHSQTPTPDASPTAAASSTPAVVPVAGAEASSEARARNLEQRLADTDRNESDAQEEEKRKKLLEQKAKAESSCFAGFFKPMPKRKSKRL